MSLMCHLFHESIDGMTKLTQLINGFGDGEWLEGGGGGGEK